MTERKTLVGISLLCALAFCACAAANASAIGTTANTCIGGVEFKDAHCDQESPGGTGGSFGHEEFAGVTNVVAKNNATGGENPVWKLNGMIAGMEVEIEVATINDTATLKNVAGPPMKVTGEGTLELNGAKLLKPAAQAANCSVAIAELPYVSETKEMEMVFRPPAGAVLTQVTIFNAPGKNCKALAGVFNLEGTLGATGQTEAVLPKHVGATLGFTPVMTEKSLLFAGNIAKLQGTLTFRKAPVGGVEQKPIVLTTE